MAISSKNINDKKNIYLDANTLLNKMEKRKTSNDRNQLNKLRDLEKHGLHIISTDLSTIPYGFSDLFKSDIIGDIGRIDKKYLHELKKQNKLLEDRIDKLEKILVSGNIPRKVPRPYFDEITARAVEDGLVNSLYRPLTKGIAFSSGFFAIASLLFVSGLVAIPFIVLCGFFGYIYLKLNTAYNKQKLFYFNKDKKINKALTE